MSIQQLRIEKAKKVSELIKLRNRIVNRKQAHDDSQSSSKMGPSSSKNGSWKRIRVM
jgi:hypothetical protein